MPFAETYEGEVGDMGWELPDGAWVDENGEVIAEGGGGADGAPWLVDVLLDVLFVVVPVMFFVVPALVLGAIAWGVVRGRRRASVRGPGVRRQGYRSASGGWWAASPHHGGGSGCGGTDTGGGASSCASSSCSSSSSSSCSSSSSSSCGGGGGGSS